MARAGTVRGDATTRVPMHTPMTRAALCAVARAFDLAGECEGGEPYGSGHINDTFMLYVRGAAYRRVILQRINNDIFRDVPALMDNILRVTRHLQRRASAGAARPHGRQEALTLIPSRSGAPCMCDEAGRWWRMYHFIEGARTYDVVPSPAHARAAAATFGRFQRGLATLPPPPLHETIPHFHDTPWRLQQLEVAAAQDARGRAAGVQEELQFVRARTQLAGLLCNQLAHGDAPWRVTHNDTKINNVMLDEHSGHGVCVIDLDTVMPGAALFDFGDCVRTATACAAEDEPHLDRVGFNAECFAALADGFLESMAPLLTRAELEALHLSGIIITLEIGARFLTDYLAGDIYFKTKYPEHNLVRARTQFRMVELMEQQQEELRRVVAHFAERHDG